MGRLHALCTLALTGCFGHLQPLEFAVVGDSIERTERLPIDRKQQPRAVRAKAIRIAVAPAIREVSGAGIVPRPVGDSPWATAEARERLPAPHRKPPPALPVLSVPADLRALVGHRDGRDPMVAVLGWARDLGVDVDRLCDEPGPGDTIEDLVACAERAGRLRPASEPPERGDLLVFGRVLGDEPADLIAIVIGRDERSVTELLYVGGGVVRRGFVDTSRPHTRRDRTGAVVNTFVRHGKRWPPKGTRYLAGELLEHLIRTR